jgi:RNA polymerase sigma-70 factor (ECF subfamily)
MYQITRNAIVDYYRGQKPTIDVPQIFPSVDGTPQDTPHQEIASGLKFMIDDLPEKYQQALLLTEYQGLTQKELAQHLGISVSGAKSRVQRARQKLKDQLMQCCHFEFDRYGTIIDYHPITCCCCAADQCK